MSRSTTHRDIQFDLFLTHTWAADEEGRDNHARVALINEALKRKGFVTWFDSERMAGEVRRKMTTGIDKSKCVVVFVTKKYMMKVNDETVAGRSDNVKYELNYTYDHSEVQIMVVVMEGCMLDQRNWEGEFRGMLKRNLFVSLAGDLSDKKYIGEQVDALVEQLERLDILPSGPNGATSSTQPARSTAVTTQRSTVPPKPTLPPKPTQQTPKPGPNGATSSTQPTRSTTVTTQQQPGSAAFAHASTSRARKASPNFTKCRYNKCTTKSKVFGKSKPQPRWYHVSVVMGDQVVVLGGHDKDGNKLTGEDVWSYDITNTAWKCHKTTGDIPTLTYASTGWLHRGCVHLFGGGFPRSNAVHRLNTSYNWTLVRTTGTPPSPRFQHASWLIEDRVFVFGGDCSKPSDLHPNEQYDGYYNNQLHTLQLDTMSWTHPVVTGRLPSPRCNCAYAVVGGVAYLFGGWGNGTRHNDLYRLETERFVWSKITTTGALPSGRYSCTMTCMNENSFMICGGYGSGGDIFSDVWLFDIDDREWKEVETDNMRRCYGHTTSITHDKQILLFGGEDRNAKTTNEFGIISFT